MTLKEINLSTSVPLLSFLREENRYTDVIFNVTDGRTTKIIPAHRFILMSVSLYFQRMFLSDLKETHHKVIDISSMNPDLFEAFIRSIYGTPISLEDWRVALALLKIIHFYEVITVDVKKALPLIDVPPQGFADYVDTIHLLYDGEIPGDYIPYLAQRISFFTDFSNLTDEFIEALFKDEKYEPKSEMETFHHVQKLVEAGRDLKMYQLIRLKSVPKKELALVPQEIQDLCNHEKIRISAAINIYTNNLIKFIQEQFRTNEKGSFVAHVIGYGDSHVALVDYQGIGQNMKKINYVKARFNERPTIGDIIRVLEYQLEICSQSPSIEVTKWCIY